jgi:hypothetical protein
MTTRVAASNNDTTGESLVQIHYDHEMDDEDGIFYTKEKERK